MKTKKTQTARIMETLNRGKTLTSAQMIARGIMSPRKRVSELRASGVKIVSVPYRNTRGNTAFKYTLAPQTTAQKPTVVAKASKVVKTAKA